MFLFSTIFTRGIVCHAKAQVVVRVALAIFLLSILCSSVRIKMPVAYLYVGVTASSTNDNKLLSVI